MSLSGRLFYIAVLSTAPSLVYAHTPVEGVGNFYNGLLHPVLVAAQLLSLIVVGLLFGQQGRKSIRLTLPAFLVALIIGLGIVAFDVTFNAEITLLVISVIIGILVALALHLPQPMNLFLAIALGIILGLDSPQEELWGVSKFYALVGTFLGAMLCIAFTTSLALFLNRSWQRILVRILGSWGAASAFMVLATFCWWFQPCA